MAIDLRQTAGASGRRSHDSSARRIPWESVIESLVRGLPAPDQDYDEIARLRACVRPSRAVKWLDRITAAIMDQVLPDAHRGPFPAGRFGVALTSLDKALLQRCLTHEPGAWNDFIDRYLGLFYHVIRYTAFLRSVTVSAEEVEDIAAEVLLQVVANDYALFRQFRGQSSLATYLAVVARRICAHELARRKAGQHPTPAVEREAPSRTEAALEDLDEVQKLLRRLPTREREVVRLFYLEGRTYEEISTELHIPVNTIGPVLSRAKKKLRDGAAPSPATPKVNMKSEK